MNTAQASIRHLVPNWPAKRISILLTIVALMLWSYSITQAKFEIGFYGLIRGFPITFFVALGILTIASAILWVSKEDHGKLLFVQLCFLVVSIWLAPLMVGGSRPGVFGSYQNLGMIDYISRHGRTNPGLLFLHNWPGGWVLWPAAIRVLGIGMHDVESSVPWLPVIWQCIIFFPVFVFFRNTVGKANPNYCWAAMWLFYLGFWFEIMDTGGHTFGIFFFFSILALLTLTPGWKQRAKALEYRFSAVILLAVSAVTHLLGSFVSLCVVAALYVSKRVRSSNLVIIAAVFILAWSMYGAISFFEGRIPDLLKQSLRIDIATQNGVLNPLSGNKAHAMVASVKILFSGLFVAIGISGALLAWKLRKITHNDITVLAIAAGSGITIVGIGAGYGHELYERFFIFILPAIAYFGIKLLHFRATAVILCLLLLIALPLAFVARYGDQKSDYLSPGYLSGAAFFQDNTATHDDTTKGFIAAVAGGAIVGRMRYVEHIMAGYALEDLKWQDNKLVRFGYVGLNDDTLPRYVCISNNDRAVYDYLSNEPQLINEVESSLDAATNCNLVYANPDLGLYIAETWK